MTLELNETQTVYSTSASEGENNNEVNRDTSTSYSSPSLLTLEPIADKIEIYNFITGKKSNSSKLSNEIDLVFSVENNKQNILNLDKLASIKDYKIEINNKYYEMLENKASMLLSSNNTAELFSSIFSNNIKTFDEVASNIFMGIEEKTSLVKRNMFETIFKNFINSQENVSSYFSIISNSFLLNLQNTNNSKSLSSNTRFDSFEPEENPAVDFIDYEYLKTHNLIELQNSTQYEYAKEVSTTTNDIIVQNFVNMTRSLYFMSTGALNENIVGDRFNSTNYDKEAFRVYKHETNDLDIFENISLEKDTIDIDKYIGLKHKSLRDKQNSNLVSTNNYFINSISDESINNIQYLPSFLSRYIDDVMIDKLSVVEHITPVTGFILDTSLAVINMCNKVYVGDFFNVDLLKFGPAYRDAGIQIIDDYIVYSPFRDENEFVRQSGIANYTLYKEQFKENYVNNLDSEVIYKGNTSITKLEEGRVSNEGQVRASDIFNIDDDRLLWFSDLDYKIKIDSFVKRHKLKHLKSQNIDLNFSNQIIENIKDTHLKNKMVAYSKDNDHKLSVINQENDVYDLLFTNDEEDENSVYSHIDLVSNHEIDNVNFLSIDEMKKNDIDINENLVNVRDNIKNMLSNYYPENSFFSTSNLFKKVLSSVVDEASISDTVMYEENNITQLLYLNYFKDSLFNKTKVKETIAKRFIKKAIQLDGVSSRSFRNSGFLSSYAYDIDGIFEEDFDESSKQSMKSYVNKILDSSENLKIIKNSVFGLQNISNISKISDFKRVSNFKFYKDVVSEIWHGSAVLNLNVLPNYCMLYSFKSKGDFNEDGKLSYDIEKRNKLKEITKYGDVNESTGERVIESQKFYIDRSIDYFDVTSSPNILVKVTPKLCKSDESRELVAFPYIILEDRFDSIFKNDNSNKFVFYKIIDIIQDLLRMRVADYKAKAITSEEDIDSILAEDEEIISEVINLLELFSDIYTLYTARLQRLQSIKIFEWQEKSIEHAAGISGTNTSFLYNGIISKHSNVYNTFKDAMGIGASKQIDIITSDESLDCVSDIDRLLQIYSNDATSYITSEFSQSLVTASFKTHMTDKFYDIAKTLMKSDFSQAFTFDIINGYINYQDKILNTDRENLTSSNKFNSISEIKKETVEEIENNFYNMFYINKLSKILLLMSSINNANNTMFENYYTANTSEAFKNTDMFSTSKEIVAKNINMTGSNIKSSNENAFQKQVFFNDEISYLNSSFYSFAAKTKSLSSYNYDAIIKVTVSLVDKFNLNKFFIPKVFLFTPMFTDISHLTPDMLKLLGVTSNTRDFIGVYDANQGISNRISIKQVDDSSIDHISSETTGVDAMLIAAIKTKLNVSSDEDAMLYYKHMIYCHSSSAESAKITKNVYDINSLDDYKQSNAINEDLFNIVNNLSGKQYYDIFDANKTTDMLNTDLNSEGKYDMNLGYDTIDKKSLSHDLLKRLKDIANYDDIETNLNNEYYDTYNIAINPKSFYYIDTNQPTNTDNEYEMNDLEMSFNKLLKIEDITSSESAIVKQDNLEIEDFNIVFDIEIL
jgi:hypothetical protein